MLLSHHSLTILFHTFLCQWSILELSFTVLELSYHCLRAVLLISHHSHTLLFHTSVSMVNLAIVLELSYYNLITVLFCSSTPLLCVRGETSCHSKTILLLVLELPYYCLIIVHTSPVSEVNLAIILELSYSSL